MIIINDFAIIVIKNCNTISCPYSGALYVSGVSTLTSGLVVGTLE